MWTMHRGVRMAIMPLVCVCNRFKRNFTKRVQLLCVCIVLILLAISILVNRENTCHTNRSGASSSVVFIGGHPRSGTTLMRILLDVHPMIRCGPETAVIPKLLFYLRQLEKGPQRQRLSMAKLYPEVIHSAFRAFIWTVIEKAGSPAPILCNKDPLSFLYLHSLSELFPDAKFIHVVRDGRAVVASLIKRKININQVELTPEDNLDQWQNITWQMLQQCADLGPFKCFTVFYERLVLRPNEQMREVLVFLGVPWNPVVLQHEFSLNNTLINTMEPSASQVTYPLHLKALTAWATNGSVLTSEFIHTAHKRSWLLTRLGYSKSGIPPVYGTPEPYVVNKTEALMKNTRFVQLYT